jgi:hypothetical protein
MVANGAAKAVNTSAGAAERQAGQILIKTALILQACTFRAYVAILAVWHTRARGEGLVTGNLRRVVAVMYAIGLWSISRVGWVNFKWSCDFYVSTSRVEADFDFRPRPSQKHSRSILLRLRSPPHARQLRHAERHAPRPIATAGLESVSGARWFDGIERPRLARSAQVIVAGR